MSFSYTLKHTARAKRLRITIYRDASVVVTAPKRASTELIERFITEKSSWIQEKREQFLRNPIQIQKLKGNYTRDKEIARKIVEAKVAQYNKIYNFPVKKIVIRNQKTRWGSCSRKGNLNFNYKIALIPERLAEYIVVHELCHLGEFNHSKRFWNLVAQTIPEYKELRKELKKIC